MPETAAAAAGQEGFTPGAILSGPDDSIFDSIFDWIQNAISSIVQPVTDWITRAWSAIVSTITSWVSWAVSSISSWWQNVLQWVQNAVDWARATYNAVTSWVSSAYNTVSSAVTSAIGRVGDWVSSSARTVTDWVTSKAGEITRSVSSFFSSIWTNISAGFDRLWSGFTSELGRWAGDIKGFFQSVVSSIESTVSSIWARLDSTFTWLTGWMEDHIVKPLADWLPQIMKSILDFPSWVGKLFDSVAAWVTRDIPGASPWWHTMFDAIGNFLYQTLIGAPVSILKYLTVGAIQTIQTFVVPVTGVFWEFFNQFVNGIASVTSPIGPIAPEHGLDIMTTLNKVSATVIAGLLGMTLAGELTVIGSKLGLGNISAMIYDLTNYKMLTGAFVTALAAAAVAIPLRHYYQDKFRTNIPSIREASDFYASDDLPLDGFKQLLGYQGIPDTLHDAYADSAYRAPSPYQLSIAASAGTIDEAVLGNELRRAGYHPSVRKMYLDAFRKVATGNVKAVMVASATGRFKLGMTDEGALTSELQILNVGDSIIPLYVAGAKLDYATSYLSDLITAYTDAVRSGQLGLEDFRAKLLGLGLVPERVEAKVLIEKLRIKPKAELTPIGIPNKVYLTDQGKIEVETIRIRRIKNTITRAKEETALLALGMPTDYAATIADNDNAKLLEKVDLEPKAAVPLYKTDAGKVNLDTIRDSRRKNTIDASAELAALAALGVPEYLATAIVDNDTITLEEKIPTAAAPATPLYETEAGKIKVDTIRRARRKLTITRADEIAQLQELDMPDWLAETIVENDDIRLAGKGEGE